MTKFLASLLVLGLMGLTAVIGQEERFPSNPDGAIFRTTLEGGTSVVTGYSTNQATSPDGKSYPAEVRQHSEFPTKQPLGGEDSHPQDGVSEIGGQVKLRGKRQISQIGFCRVVLYWVRPWWVYWGNIWWPVMNSPWWGWHWYHWWYCLPSLCKVSIADPGNIRYLCSRCRTEWGWIRVPIWYYWIPRWIWIRAPVGCCCDIRNQWWC
ncbi:uncharacterized protein LOC106177158 [Lingula anatina]|uniref:Uncharacterized protein LOC106177158 n=1 Tax=Lingula anatina TaxID=7574 RepID=A0A1S3JY10_LINAN|nr:uncharacterized protein LOC106177158 [Lingula anatina]|eukprot:XP_013415300.1 uncharacterized protein LOC106177158 [Lingula anatina]